MKYKLDIKRDVDYDGHPDDEDCGYILNLVYGWRFSDDSSPSHVKGFDSMKELRDEIKNNVSKCNCKECLEGIAKDSASK